MSKVIQFFHPGGEHSKKSGSEWNTGNHKRKYLKVQGSYLNSVNQKQQSKNLYFWGEWEAQSNIIKELNHSNSLLPKLIFEPYYKQPIGNVNTDPFVFGNQFHYCICKQGHYPSLREKLEKGDIILFGSHKNDAFILDTLFVIKDWIEYEVENIDEVKSKFNKVFVDVSLLPLTQIQIQSKQNSEIKIEEKTKGCYQPVYTTDDDESIVLKKKYRVYSAAMYSDRDSFDGIYSFAPAMVGGENGFERPKIKLDGILSQSQNQGIKISENQNKKEVWESITKQLFNQKLSLLIETELPPVK